MFSILILLTSLVFAQPLRRKAAAKRLYAKLETDIVGDPITDDEYRAYTDALFAAVSANGMHDEEEEWVRGHQYLMGCPDEIVEECSKNLKTVDEIVEEFNRDENMIACERIFVYHALTACSQDGDLNDAEVRGIERIAAAMDLPADIVKDTLQFIAEEKSFYQKKFDFVWRGKNPWSKDVDRSLSQVESDASALSIQSVNGVNSLTIYTLALIGFISIIYSVVKNVRSKMTHSYEEVEI